MRKYRDDTSPLDPGIVIATPVKTTQAYLYHLDKCGEF